MTEAIFPAHISAVLDRLTAPGLPVGFTERLLARIEAGDLPAEAISELPPLPAPRRPITGARRWLRPGRVIAGAALLGVATATAAASGVFGDPVYVPVVSEVLAKADVVELPTKAAAAKPSKPVASSSAPKVSKATGTVAVRQLYEQLRSDPDFRALPPRERTAAARKELEAMLQAGTIQPSDIRTVMAEERQAREERNRKQLDKAFGKLKEAAERREKYRNAGPQEQAEMREEQRLRAAEMQDRIKAAYDSLPAADQQRLLELRHALRNAPPAQRPAIRREIRGILLKAAPKVPPGEGNPDPAR